jgi:hypothetical protein
MSAGCGWGSRRRRWTACRRTALGIGLIGTLSPAALAGVLRESAAQALEFTSERAVTAVGVGTLDHLTAVIVDLDRAYPWRPAAELFPWPGPTGSAWRG